MKSGASHLLHLVWLTTQSKDRDRLIDQLFMWLDTVVQSQQTNRDYLFVLLIVDALSACTPSAEVNFACTGPYAVRAEQLLALLDKMHNDKKKTLARILHLSERKPCSLALQMFASAVSQFLQVCMYYFDNKDGKSPRLRVSCDDPHVITGAVLDQSQIFHRRMKSPEVTSQFDANSISSLEQCLHRFIQTSKNPASTDTSMNTIDKWPELVASLVRSLWPSIAPLAELR